MEPNIQVTTAKYLQHKHIYNGVDTCHRTLRSANQTQLRRLCTNPTLTNECTANKCTVTRRYCAVHKVHWPLAWRQRQLHEWRFRRQHGSSPRSAVRSIVDLDAPHQFIGFLSGVPQTDLSRVPQDTFLGPPGTSATHALAPNQVRARLSARVLKDSSLNTWLSTRLRDTHTHTDASEGRSPFRTLVFRVYRSLGV